MPRPPETADPHVQQLRAFVAVFEHRGYAEAARRLGRSVPTVWEQVRALEAIYDTNLFKKVGRRIEPTDAARRLHEALSPILAGLDSTFELVRQGAAPGQARYTLVTGVRMMLEDLAEPLAAFRARHPEIRLHIRQGNDAMAEQLILADEADLAFSLEPGLQQESKRVHYEPVYSVDFLAVMRPDHPLAVARRLTLKELAKHDLVVGAPEMHVRRILEEALHREELAARVVVDTDTAAFTVACVRAGMGVGVLAGDADGILCRDLAVRSLRRPLGRCRIMVMFRRGRHLPQPLVELIRLVREQ